MRHHISVYGRGLFQPDPERIIKMSKERIGIYDPFKLANLTVKNRLIASATFEYGADQGKISPRLIDYYGNLASGGSGLVITGQWGISAGAGIAPIMVETAYDQFVIDARKLTSEAHKNGALIFCQLNHGGYRTFPAPGYDRMAVSEKEVAPGVVNREMTEADIKKVVADFGHAAARCREGGFDGVQIHAAHGYLLSTFLSPYFNKRADSYGGPIENRARILFEVYQAVRREAGQDFPVIVKLHFNDRVSPSISPQECLFVCKELERLGIDLIEVSSGVTNDGGPESFSPFIRIERDQGIFFGGADHIAKAVKVPVASVGGYRTPDFIEKALNEPSVTAISLCRPLIREPNLPNRWRTDRSVAKCVSCDKCLKSAGNGLLGCLAEK